MLTSRSLFAAFLVLATAVGAQVPVRVADINTTTGSNPSSSPRGFVALGQKTYFLATTPTTGYEVFVTDGTAAGTTLVKDTVPGPNGFSRVLLAAKNGLVGLTGNSSTAPDIWLSDGTAAGTTLLAGVADQRYPIAFNGWIYFGAENATVGKELFRTDGTVAGTQVVVDLVPGSGSSGARALGVSNNKLYFTADTGSGWGLYETDGATTTFLTLITPAASPPETLGATSNYLLLCNRSGWIWRSDGTSNPTTFVTSVGSVAQRWVAASGLLYFVPNSSPRSVWISDGTAAGTQPTSISVSATSELVAYQGSVYVSGSTPTTGFELFRFNGRTASVVRDIHPSGSSTPRSLSVLNGVLYFQASAPSIGTELWRSDGTFAGTQLVLDANPGPASGVGFQGIRVANNRLWFDGNDGTTGDEPWSSDGTAHRTMLTIDLSPPPPGTLASNPVELVDFNGVVLFAADDGQVGEELWRSDGTAAGTIRVKDVSPGPSSSNLKRLAVAERQVFFQANGNEVWRTDATTQSTTSLMTFTGGFAGFAVLKNRAIFHAVTSMGSQMWVSDGTLAGTQPLTAPTVGGSTSPVSFAVLGTTLYYAGYDSSSGWQLWATDGTPANTRKVVDVNPTSSSSLAYFVEFAGRIYFAGDDGVRGEELWVTDGTAPGTQLFYEFTAGRQGGRPRYLTPSGANLFFTVGTTLWGTDGTVAGTVALTDGQTVVSTPERPIGRSSLLFTAARGGTGTEPWISDGTVAGTRPLKDIYPGATSSRLLPGATTGSRFVYFQADDGVTGKELWVTDGTAAGTKQVADMVPGFLSSAPDGFVLSRGRVVFAADGDAAGRELWSVDPGASVQSIGRGCGGGTRVPRLSMDDPVLGAPIRFHGRDAFVGSSVNLFVAGGHPRPLSLGASCRVFVDPSSMALVGAWPVTASTWSNTVGAVPNLAALVGAPLSAQALFAPTDAARGFDLSGGLWLVVGR